MIRNLTTGFDQQGDREASQTRPRFIMKNLRQLNGNITKVRSVQRYTMHEKESDRKPSHKDNTSSYYLSLIKCVELAILKSKFLHYFGVLHSIIRPQLYARMIGSKRLTKTHFS